MPVVCEGFQESLDDRSLSRKSEGLQVEPQGLINTKPLEGECAAKKGITLIEQPKMFNTTHIKHANV